MAQGQIAIYIHRIDDATDSSSVLLADAEAYARSRGISFPVNPGLTKTAKGKPFFALAPQIYCSLSHSGDYLLTAFSDVQVGIDIQQHVDCRKKAIAERYFTTEEYNWLKNNNFSNFFAVWTAKESFVKYTGEGMSLFSQFSVVDKTAIGSEIEGAQLRFWPFSKDYTVCVCADEISVITVESKEENK